MDKKTQNEVIEILKSKGLVVGEEMAVTAVKAAFALVGVLVPRISTGLGRIIMPLISYAESEVLGMVDKIDGVDSPDY